MKAILLITLLPFLGILSLTAEPDWIVKGFVNKAYGVASPANHLLPEGFHPLTVQEDGYHMVIVIALSDPPEGCPIPKGGYTLITPRDNFPNPWPRFHNVRTRTPVTVIIKETDQEGIYTFTITRATSYNQLTPGPYVQMLSQD